MISRIIKAIDVPIRTASILSSLMKRVFVRRIGQLLYPGEIFSVAIETPRSCPKFLGGSLRHRFSSHMTTAATPSSPRKPLAVASSANRLRGWSLNNQFIGVAPGWRYSNMWRVAPKNIRRAFAIYMGARKSVPKETPNAPEQTSYPMGR
jgi:hypothetical protein